MAKKNFYVVLKGRKPGIYTRWSGEGGAEEQTKGYPGAVFKGFETREEAESYQRTGKALPASRQVSLLPGEGARPAAREAPAKADHGAAGYHKDLAEGKAVIFTDGASTGNPGPGGYGVVLLYGGSRKELSGGFRCTTNNRMELLACIVALQTFARSTPAVIYSDSRYVVNAVEKGWARRWHRNGWMRAPDSSGNSEPAINIDLWEQMLDLLDQHPVEFRWVKGHANNPENERCDQLAVQAARGRSLPSDPGYEGRCR